MSKLQWQAGSTASTWQAGNLKTPHSLLLPFCFRYLDRVNRRDFLKATTVGMLSSLSLHAASKVEWQENFYLMDTWFWKAGAELTVPKQVDLLHQLGYAGMALSWGEKHSERLLALRQKNLAVPGCYIVADMGEGFPQKLRDCVAFLKGTGASVWLALNTRNFARSDASGDNAALELIQECVDNCRKWDVPGIVLYPHVGCWMERVSDAVRLAQKINLPEVSVQFNQYHWMAAEKGENLRTTLKSARPFLKGVSINGSDVQPSILPLSEGTYDVLPILQNLYKLEYNGPISHQGYSIEGNLPERLAGATKAWEKLRKQAMS